MELDNGENLELDTPPTSSQPTVSKEEILKGDVNIPIKDVFGFVIQHISETYGQRMGVGSVIDRNFLYFQQLGFRKRIEQICKYTFLHPLVVEEKKGSPVLIAVEPYSQCKNELGQLVDKKAFILYILAPKLEEPSEDSSLNRLNEFFQNVVRDRTAEKQGLQFAHILASIVECHDGGYIHFTIEDESAAEGKRKNNWAFEYHEGNLFVYQIPHNPPYEALEMPILSPWISTTQPYFRRDINSSHHFKFTADDIELIRNDPEVKLLQTKNGDEKEDMDMESGERK